MFRGVDGNGVFLKDIVPTTTDPAGISAGDFIMYTMGTDRAPTGNYTYKPYKKTKKGETIAGWYDANDALDTTTRITYGQGVMLYSEKQVTLTFSGEVVQAAPAFTAEASGYYRCGNINPTDVCITNLVPTAESISAADFIIYTYDNQRSPTGNWTYKPYKETKKGETLAGWYDANDALDTTKTFAPGEGFVLFTEKAMTLTFPNPVK